MTCIPHPISRAFLRVVLFIVSYGFIYAASSTAAPARKEANFDIPAGAAVNALKQFSAQSGQQLLYSSTELAGVTTNEVKGKLNVADALARLLAGTPLVASHDSKNGAVAVGRSAPENPDPNVPRAARRTTSDRPARQSAATTGVPNSSGTGTIAGRVFNPASGEYVRNAEVRIQGMDQIILTESDGAFRFDHVPAGTATVTIAYIGYDTANERFDVIAGQTASREIRLSEAARTTRLADGTLKLQEFVVNADREGNAKAIMEQRRSMNIVNSVSSDAFGDIVEGNIGEFLRYVPGVELEYVDNLIRAPRLRGMEPQYTSIAIDGVRVAGADGQMAFAGTDNTGTGEGARSAGFEAITLNNIESIEVAKTLSADMDADAPAGAINFKPKRAFDRKGRLVTWQARAAFNSEEFHLRRSQTWGEQNKYKIFPGATLEYSDVFLDRRLGIIANLNYTNTYARTFMVQHAANTAATAADPRPVVYTGINFFDVPNGSTRRGAGTTIDFKASDHLTLSFQINWDENVQKTLPRVAFFGLGARHTVLGDNPLMSFRTSAAGGNNRGLVSMPASWFVKETQTTTLVPKLEYRRGNWIVEAKGSFSRAVNTYSGLRHGFVSNVPGARIGGLDFAFERTNPNRPGWSVTQLSGPDWSDLRSYSYNPPQIFDFDRAIENERYAGQIDVRYNFRRFFLSHVKAGVKQTGSIQRHNQSTLATFRRYVGPNSGTTGAFVDFPTPFPMDMGDAGVVFRSVTGAMAPPAHPSPRLIADAMNKHPEYFEKVPISAINYFNVRVRDHRRLRERVPSAYLMTAGRHRKLQYQAGLRYEETHVMSREPNPRTRAEVLAAGYAVSPTTGVATTVEGVDYQYFSRPKIWRKGKYHNYFSSASLKYSLAQNLDFHAGYNKAILRPALSAISGAWVINEDQLRVFVPNPNLRPEVSDNYSARISYFLRPVGTLSVGVFQNDVANLRERAELTAEEFGNNDPLFSEYTFITQSNGLGSRRFRGMEFEYNQTLGLPGIWRGLTVSATYVRNYANVRRAGLVPNRYTAGLAYKYGGFNLRLNGAWADETPWLATSQSAYRPKDARYDLSGGYQFSRRFGVFFVGRNITNEPAIVRDRIGNTTYLIRYSEFGASWTFGVKGSF